MGFLMLLKTVDDNNSMIPTLLLDILNSLTHYASVGNIIALLIFDLDY
jgi:hypothetical protein